MPSQAFAHRPELAGALVALGAAIVGGITQMLVKAGATGRAIWLTGTAVAVTTALMTGVAVTHARTPSPTTISRSVYAVPAPAGAIPLPLDAVDSEATPGYPTVVRKWQLGGSFLRSNPVMANAALTHACSLLRTIATPRQGWQAGRRDVTYCSFERVSHHVSLRYSATVTPGAIATNQIETVTIYLVGVIASRSNS